MADVELTPAVFIPTKGLDVYHDPTVLPLNYAQVCWNWVIKNDVLTVREGSPAAASQAYWTDNGNPLLVNTITALHKAYYGDPDLTITSRMYGICNGKLIYYDVGYDYWKNVDITGAYPYVTLSTSSYGTFVQYRDSVYYTNAVLTTPVRPIVVQNDNTVDKAGVDSPDSIKMICDCDTTTNWTAGTADTNTTHYVEGSGGILCSITAASTTTAFYCSSLSVDVSSFSAVESSSGDDYIAFYMYRWEKARLKSLDFKVYTGGVGYFLVHLIDQTIDQIVLPGETNPGSRYFMRKRWSWKKTRPRTFLDTWDSDDEDYKMFLVKVRKDWFSPVTVSANTPSWSTAISKIEFLMTSDAHTSSGNPCKITVDYAHMRKTAPQANTHGLQIATFEPIEGWTTPTNVALTSAGAVGEGAWCLELTGTDALSSVWTVAKDLAVYPDGSIIKARDRMWVWLYSSVLAVVTITFTDSQGHTAARNFTAYRKEGGRRVSSTLALFTYTGGAGTFASFQWGEIVSITVSKAGSTQTVRVDDLYLEQTANMKLVCPFEALDLRLMTAIGKFAETYFSEVPFVAQTVDFVTDGYTKVKYRTIGAGSLTYPDTETFEPNGLSTCSMKISASGEENDNTITDGLLRNDGNGGGMRVWWKRRFINAVTSPLDLTKYYSWTGLTPHYTADIDGNDKFRIWVHVDKPQNLSRIAFRLYYPATFASPTQSDESGYFDLPEYNASDNFYEYIYDATAMYDKKTEKAAKSFGYGTGQSEKLPVSVPGWGTFTVNPNDALQYITGDDKYSNIKYEDGTVSTILEWRRNDMLRYRAADDGSGDDGSWAKIIGYEIQVIPMPGKSVSVNFDNWFIHSADAPSGQYWYKVTNVDRFGVESAASDTSLAVEARSKKIYVSKIPKPPTSSNIVARNIYRKGGNSVEWRLAGVLADNTQSAWLDEKGEDELGKLCPEDAWAPPACKVMSLVGMRMAYGNIADRFNKVYPSRVMLSEPFYPGKVKDSSAIDVCPNDGSEVTAITMWGGQIVIFKNFSIWTLDPNTFEPILRHSGIGCIATRSVVTVPEGIIFLSHKGVMMTNINTIDDQIGLVVSSRFEGKSALLMSVACAALIGDSYWLFYDKVGWDGSTAPNQPNQIGLVCHLPTKTWTEQRIQVGLVTEGSVPIYGQVHSIYVDKGVMSSTFGYNVYTGIKDATNSKYRVLQILSGDSDRNIQTGDALDITATYRTGDYDLDACVSEKRLIRLFVRSKYAGTTSTASYVVTPYVEQNPVAYGGSTWTIPFTATTPVAITTLTDEHITNRYVPAQGGNGYLQGIQIVATKRLSISKVAALYNKLEIR